MPPQIALKALNDKSGPSELVSTLLVIFVVLRMPVKPAKLPIQSGRTKALFCARKEMSRILNKSKLQTALYSKVPGFTDHHFKIGDEVLMSAEKLIGKWIGPYMIHNVDGKS